MNEQNISVHIFRTLIDRNFSLSQVAACGTSLQSVFPISNQMRRPIKCKSATRGLSPNYAMYSFEIKYLYLHLKQIFSLHFDHFAE